MRGRGTRSWTNWKRISSAFKGRSRVSTSGRFGSRATGEAALSTGSDGWWGRDLDCVAEVEKHVCETESSSTSSSCPAKSARQLAARQQFEGSLSPAVSSSCVGPYAHKGQSQRLLSTTYRKPTWTHPHPCYHVAGCSRSRRRSRLATRRQALEALRLAPEEPPLVGKSGDRSLKVLRRSPVC